jgi:hypothetical protein
LLLLSWLVDSRDAFTQPLAASDNTRDHVSCPVYKRSGGKTAHL